ncbi:ATP-binding cassette domain-containing protein [Gardnerella greenwoodii]|uniref:ABC transporter ATP-binding protein n=1 Tax=Gardnerella greenwoodii TaxID=2914925 RepID=A0A2N6RYH4_9BIFI|nr:ATP-binding cassette domain-containing protein [Gardnerella greenwoodii]MDF0753438.1 ATP-binding cassette domain-containing protein [Gardnerella greenwoodii]PMC43159.1 ABC transporter ATP-binding protein [Gardnerella greenwoodii]
MPDAVKSQESETFLPSASSDCNSDSSANSAISNASDSANKANKANNAELRFEHWGYRHASRRAFAVRGLDLTIKAGERVLLLGASGIGKSTILSGAAGLIGNDFVTKNSAKNSADSADSVENSAKSQQTTLVEDADGGVSEGRVLVDGVPVRRARGKVGLVLQDPDAQAIFQRLGDNVAFGPENMNVPREEIWDRVRESLKKVGLDGLQLHRSTSHLSGGQMQRLALAGALAMQPSVLLLDEPTANLDPDGTQQIVGAVRAVLDSTHATMVLVEHHAEPWIDMIDRVVVLGLENDEDANGNANSETVHDDDIARAASSRTVIVADGTPDDVFNRTDLDFEDLGIWLPERYKKNVKSFESKSSETCNPSEGYGEVLLSTNDLAISHSSEPIARHINLEFRAGQITALVGANGTGKSTLSLTLAGLLPAVSGDVVASEALAKGANGTNPMKWKSPDLAKRISYVFQNPEHQFACGSVLDEVMLGPLRTGVPADEARAKAQELLKRFRLARYANANPYTLSGGEKRRLTVAASLAAAPRVLILDEPTFGQDRKTWLQIIRLIASLRGEGVSIIVVTHDRELVEALDARLVELVPDAKAECAESAEVTEDAESEVSAESSESSESSEALSATTGATDISQIKVSAVNNRSEKPKLSSRSPLIASMNPVFRIFGAFAASIPLIFTLDCVSASVALVLEFAIFACIKLTPWRVIYLSWPVWVGAPTSALTVLLYGKSGGNTWFQWWLMHATDRSAMLAVATALRILAIGIPSIVMVIGMDATDLADAFSQVLHLPDRFVYGGLAGIRLFGVLQDDWAALTASRRSRGLGDEHRVRAFFPQSFALLVLSIRRSTTLATAMEARGFGGVGARSHARVSSVHARDWWILVVCAIVPLVSVASALYFGTFAFLGGA